LFANLIVLILASGSFIYSQKTIVANKNEDLAKMKLEDVKIRTQGVSGVFSSISLNYNIPLGLEIALNDDHLTFYKIEFNKGTLSDLLDQIISQINKKQNQYIWKINDGVVHVFPKQKYRDEILNSILEIKIKNFSVKKQSSCRGFTTSLIASSEINEALQVNGLSQTGWNFSGMYIPQVGKEFTFEVSDLTMRQILNKTVKESPIAKNWFIRRSTYDLQKFDLGLNAGHEDSMKKFGKPIALFDDIEMFSNFDYLNLNYNFNQ
jgi:hypothetical protein